jgi:ferredoxin-nitrite reductase
MVRYRREVVMTIRPDDDPYGLHLDPATVQGVPFTDPYRYVGELNEVELNKLRRHPFEVAQAVITRYAKEGPSAIASVPGEIERLKWVGIYPQRQGGDAFMMRVKVPGGLLTDEQARVIGLAAESFGRGPVEHPLFGNHYCDITTRQTIQLHWLHLSDIPRIWERFAEVGLTSVMACGDCARNVTSCPVSGVDPHEVVDGLAAAQAISSFFTGNRVYANLPRKFKIGIGGCLEDCSRVEINDIAFSPARLGDDVGFAVAVGGGLSDGERLASDLDLFVHTDEVVELSRAVAHVFAELGNRENRGLARMRYLVQELGPEGFRQELVNRLQVPARRGATKLATSYRRDHVGVHPQRQSGLNYVGAVVPAGRLIGRDLVEVSRLAERYGDGTVRLGVDQNFILSGVPTERVDALLAEELFTRYPVEAGPFTRGIAACTGNEFCRFAITETKERAVRLARRLDERAKDLPANHPLRDKPLRIHISGCSASCAQPQIADVGLRGATKKTERAVIEAYDIGLGGSVGPDAGFGDWIEGAVPAERLDTAIWRVATAFAERSGDDESFASWSRRTDNNVLRDIVNGRES